MKKYLWMALVLVSGSALLAQVYTAPDKDHIQKQEISLLSLDQGKSEVGKLTANIAKNNVERQMHTKRISDIDAENAVWQAEIDKINQAIQDAGTK